ncbi:hypothetical protein FGB62_218g00 [Gracilaria domingensis]|nr:hypothetical protein FGB62_218g00 [Gracilaria domingensis]
MATLSRCRPLPNVDSRGAHVLCATTVPDTGCIITATDGPELVCGEEQRITTEDYAREIACVRYATFATNSLPEQKAVVLALINGLDSELADELQAMCNRAHMFSVATLGSDLVAESFRVALAKEATVFLHDIDPVREKVRMLGDYVLPERIALVEFSKMTIVLGGVFAVEATVERSENQKRQSSAADGGTAVLSLIGGFFKRLRLSAVGELFVGFALPENRWVLRADEELVTYSSFGEKLEELENVFKSRSGMDISDSIVSLSTTEETSSQQVRRKERSNSMSLLASVATGKTNRTVLDEALAKKAERSPQSTIFSSPFVLSISANNEVMAFTANGSELVDDLETLIEEKGAANELRLALSLVLAEQVDRMLSLRRLLAVESRNQDWHDAAIYLMQNIVNTVIKREGKDPELISEAVELRGDSERSWQADDVIATMWADFLFRLSRQIMRLSKADVDVLETLWRADASASRVRSLLQSKHGIPLSVVESLITERESILRQEEQIDALVALYTSLLVHEKALTLLEKSDVPNNFNGVSSFLSADSDDLLGRTFVVLFEEADVLLEEVVDEVCKLFLGGSGDSITEADTSDFEHTEKFSGDVIELALLAGMARADFTSRDDVFQSLRSTFGTRILYHPDATYHSYTLLQALQKAEYKALGLREWLAYLLGRQGRHEAAADDHAAEVNHWRLSRE